MKKVVEESLGAVPHFVMILPDSIHCIRNLQEMLKETERHVFVHGVVISQDECDLQHVFTVESHPSRAVGLVKVPARRKLSAAIEHTNVIQAQESSCKNILPLWILTIQPP